MLKSGTKTSLYFCKEPNVRMFILRNYFIKIKLDRTPTAVGLLRSVHAKGKPPV